MNEPSSPKIQIISKSQPYFKSPMKDGEDDHESGEEEPIT